MSEIIISLKTVEANRNVDEALEELGFKRVGDFEYDYPELGHRWYERIQTGLYEKKGKLYYYAGLSLASIYEIETIRIGVTENKKDKNPEMVFDK